jgi:hypothetical protein
MYMQLIFPVKLILFDCGLPEYGPETAEDNL